MNQTPTSRDYLRLTDGFRSSFPWGDHPNLRDGFRAWAREERDIPIHIGVHKWRPMRDGKPVPRHMIEAFSEYLCQGERPLLSLAAARLSKIAEDCDPLSAPRKPSRRGLAPLWESGWKGLFLQLIGFDGLEDEAFCDDEADLETAARMVFESAEWHHKKLTGGQAVAYSCTTLLKRSVGEYAAQLKTMWQANEHSVLFATRPVDGRVERIGVGVVCAVTADFYGRFREGRTGEIDIAAADVVRRSRHLMISAMSQNVALDMKRQKAARSVAHFRSALYQVAALALPVNLPQNALNLVSFVGNPVNEKRLRAYGFTPTEARLALNGMPIMEFAAPAPAEMELGEDHKALVEYLPMKMLVWIFQSYIASELRKRDAEA